MLVRANQFGSSEADALLHSLAGLRKLLPKQQKIPWAQFARPLHYEMFTFLKTVTSRINLDENLLGRADNRLELGVELLLGVKLVASREILALVLDNR